MNSFICEIIKIRNYAQQFTTETVKMITSFHPDSNHQMLAFPPLQVSFGSVKW